MTDNIPGKYFITFDPNASAVQYRRQRVTLEAKNDTEFQLREMIVQDTLTPKIGPTPWVSSLTYPHKANVTL